jgi:hypothetical protein
MGLTRGGNCDTVGIVKGGREGDRDRVTKVTPRLLDKVCNTW